MAEEDNFDDLDIYGDGTGEDYNETQEAAPVADSAADPSATTADTSHDNTEGANGGQEQGYDGDAHQQDSAVNSAPTSTGKQEPELPTQAISSTIGDSSQSGPPKQAPVQQGVKRKEGESDDREIAPGATSALLISDLHWYQDEDDVRGWCNQAGIEDEVKEITFNEHKVNGKSKGQVFVALQSPQAATALKSKLDSYGAPVNSDSGTPVPGAGRKHTATFHPANNPYKTLPKENPNRRGNDGGANRGGFQSRGNFNANNNARGGFNRGGMNQGGGGFNQNRNFSNQGMGGGFNNNNNSNLGGGFAGNMGGMGGMGVMNGGFNNRGGFGMNRGGNMMNRGGRGGMMGAMGGMGMPMGGNMMPGMMGMGMGGMAMGMPNMMGGGFQQGQFNQHGFQGNMGGGDWNNHPNKRQRQE